MAAENVGNFRLLTVAVSVWIIDTLSRIVCFAQWNLELDRMSSVTEKGKYFDVIHNELNSECPRDFVTRWHSSYKPEILLDVEICKQVGKPYFSWQVSLAYRHLSLGL
jgi:hypothetical protein